MSSITVLGEACLDVELAVDGFESGQSIVGNYKIVPGGSAGNVAVSLKAFGVDFTFYTPGGGDLAERLLVSFYRELGIDRSVFFVRGRGNSCLVIHIVIGGRRVVYTYRGPTDTELAGSGVENSLKNSQILHISGYGLELFRSRCVREILEKASESGTLVSLDLFPRIERVDRDLVKYLLETSDMIFGNVLEFRLLTGVLRDATPGSLSTAKLGRVVVVKAGSRGAYLYLGSQKHHVKSPRVKVVSSRGAGDVLVAAFLKEISLGADHLRALRESVESAAQHVAGKGPLNDFLATRLTKTIL